MRNVAKAKTILTDSEARMTWVYFLLFLFPFPLPSIELDPYLIADFGGEPSGLVAGCVNVITGDLVLKRDELIVRGYEPIRISLKYSPRDVTISSGVYGGWDFGERYLTITLDYQDTLRIFEKSGIYLEYSYDISKARKSKETPRPFHLKGSKSSWTNTCLGEISARYNPLNNVVYSKPKDLKEIIVEAPDGSTRYYRTNVSISKMKRGALARTSPIEFYLLSESLSNGNHLAYTWENVGSTGDRRRVTRIESKSPSGKVFAWVNIDYEPKGDKHRKRLMLSTSDYRSVTYKFDSHYNLRGKRVVLLKETLYSYRPSERYCYKQIKKKEIYPEWIIRPKNRKLWICYNHKGYNPKSHIYIDETDFLRDQRYGRVSALYQPIGTDASLYKSHTIRYSPGKYQLGGGSTDVFDAEGNLTRYDYNQHFLLTKILHFIGSDQFLFSCLFDWTDQNYLKRKTLIGKEGAFLFSRHYDYDEKGNLIREHLSGNLSGKGISTYTINREYYPNHLIKKEVFDEKLIDYTYVKNSTLLKSKIIQSRTNHLRKRFFYFYEDSILVCEIIDNGLGLRSDDLTGVTHRLIKRITPHFSNFMYGKAHVIEERYLDLSSLEEVLICKQIIHYDPKDHGNISRIDYYDANHRKDWSSTHFYDSRDRLIAKTDRLGRKREVQYDENDNPIEEIDPNEDVGLCQSYDFMNRLIKTSQILVNGEKRETTYHYNLLGQKIKEVDFRGHPTCYQYNPLGYPIKTILPGIVGIDGTKRLPIIKNTFNAFGLVTSQEDPEGNVTLAKYTARGLPYSITYADGFRESFIYDASGYHLLSHISPGNTRTDYAYDSFDRVIKKVIYSKKGEILSEESFTYDAFKLLSKTNSDGVVTTYTYNGAGQKIEEQTLDRKIGYSYDALGRIKEVIFYLENRPERVFVTTYDRLNRVIEERKEDGNGLVYDSTTYKYDDFNNQIALTKEVQFGNSTTRFFYDSFHRLLKKIDPLEQITTIDYEDHFQNHLGQKVLKKVTTDSLGRKKIEIFDPFGNLSTLEKQNPSGKTELQETFFYNRNRQKVRQVSKLYDPDKTTIKTWSYDSRLRLKDFRERGEGLTERVAKYNYTPDNDLKEVVTPSGVVISYNSDGLGRVLSISTSDFSCHYQLKYDERGRIIESDNLINQTKTIRVFNHFGNLLSETLGNRQILKRTYDQLGRRTALIFADGSKVQYHYDPYHLIRVERIGADNRFLYAHDYTQYDASGNLIGETLLSKEPIYHRVDLLSRRITTTSPYFHEEISKIDSMGNVLSCKRTYDQKVEIFTFDYDDLDQLIRENSHHYLYDSHYNRIQKDGSLYELSPFYELTKAGDTFYEQDQNGNRVKVLKDGDEINYSYDGLGRLIQIKSNESMIHLTYDFWNRCLSLSYFQIELGTWHFKWKEEYLYDKQNELGAYPHQIRILGFGKGGEIGAAIAIEQSASVLIPIHDLFGNVIALLDPKTNEPIQTYHYTAFGEEQNASNSSLNNPWRYQSKRTIKHLVLFGRRFYDPITGRWLSPDPKGFDEGPNLYQFLLNSPLLHFDSYGEAIKKLEGIKAMEEALSFDNDFENRHGGPQSINWTYIPKRDYSKLATHPLVTGEREIGYIGGINSTIEGHCRNIEKLSQYAGNLPIHATINASHGLKIDFLECYMGLNLIGTPPARLAYKRKLEFFNRFETPYPYLEIDFSQGCILGTISQLLLPEKYQKRTILVAIAPGVFSPSRLWKQSFYYCSKNDPIPKMQKIFGKIPPESENIFYLDTGKITDFGHRFDHEIYRPYLMEHCENYIQGLYD